MTRGAGSGRAVRTVLSTLLCAALTLAGHLLGGGAVPSPGATALALLGPALFCTAVAGRRWTGPRLLAALVGAQSLAHLVLSTSAPMPPMPTAPTMLAGHALATVLTASVLLRAERLQIALAALLTALKRALPQLPDSPVVTLGRSARPVTTAAARPRTLLLTLCSPRRGPPAQPAR